MVRIGPHSSTINNVSLLTVAGGALHIQYRIERIDMYLQCLLCDLRVLEHAKNPSGCSSCRAGRKRRIYSHGADRASVEGDVLRRGRRVLLLDNRLCVLCHK
jgi:hypothetical protein